MEHLVGSLPRSIYLFVTSQEHPDFSSLQPIFFYLRQQFDDSCDVARAVRHHGPPKIWWIAATKKKKGTWDWIKVAKCRLFVHVRVAQELTPVDWGMGLGVFGRLVLVDYKQRQEEDLRVYEHGWRGSGYSGYGRG